MAVIEKLTDRAIKHLKPKERDGKPISSRLGDGGGLYLRVKATGSKSWSFMWKRDGYQREMALGSYRDVSLKLARSKSRKARAALAEGIDPREALRPQRCIIFVRWLKSA